MTVDAEGCLWIAFWDGWCVRRFSPAGECLATFDVPVQRPTSCAFGGPALDRLIHHLGEHRADRRRTRSASLMPVVCLCSTRACTGLADLPFAG